MDNDILEMTRLKYFVENDLTDEDGGTMENHTLVYVDLMSSDLTTFKDNSTTDGGANYEYTIYCGDSILNCIKFQSKPLPVEGVNGITVETLLAVCSDRLQGFQNGPFPCEENAEALFHIDQALSALERRTKNRTGRGVEGKEEA